MGRGVSGVGVGAGTTTMEEVAAAGAQAAASRARRSAMAMSMAAVRRRPVSCCHVCVLPDAKAIGLKEQSPLKGLRYGADDAAGAGGPVGLLGRARLPPSRPVSAVIAAPLEGEAQLPLP